MSREHWFTLALALLAVIMVLVQMMYICKEIKKYRRRISLEGGCQFLGKKGSK